MNVVYLQILMSCMKKISSMVLVTLLLAGAGCRSGEEMVVTAPEIPEVSVVQTLPFILLSAGNSTQSPSREIVVEGYGSVRLNSDDTLSGSGSVYYKDLGTCSLDHLGYTGYVCEILSTEDGAFRVSGFVDEAGQAWMKIFYGETPMEQVGMWPASDPGSIDIQDSSAIYFLQEELGLFENFPVTLELEETVEFSSDEAMTAISFTDYDLVDVEL